MKIFLIEKIETGYAKNIKWIVVDVFNSIEKAKEQYKKIKESNKNKELYIAFEADGVKYSDT